MRILVTGGAGFIGANFVLDWLAQSEAEPVVNLDKLTYAGNLETLASLPALLTLANLRFFTRAPRPAPGALAPVGAVAALPLPP